MENKGVITCAGCGYNKERLVKCCRVTTEKYCDIGNDYSHKRGYCEERKPRFEKKEPVKQMEVYLL